MNYWNRDWVNFETGEAFAELMLDGGNYDHINDLVDKAFDSCLPARERVGYLYAWLESYVKSKFFETELTPEEIEAIDLLEIAESILYEEPPMI